MPRSGSQAWVRPKPTYNDFSYNTSPPEKKPKASYVPCSCRVSTPMGASRLQPYSESLTTSTNPHQEVSPGEQPGCREEPSPALQQQDRHYTIPRNYAPSLDPFADREGGCKTTRSRAGVLAPWTIPAQSSTGAFPAGISQRL